MDGFKDECGVFAIYGTQDAAYMAYLGLHALQHRGQESAGIAVGDGNFINIYRHMGLVSEVFTDEHLSRLKGHIAIGHVRYSTTGSSKIINAQPFVVSSKQGMIALAHNGNLVNTQVLKEHFIHQGRLFHSDSDSELLLHIIASAGKDSFDESLKEVFEYAKGAYSFVAMTPWAVAAVRDPYGFRPLVMGRIGNDTWVFASETTSLDLIGATYVREVRPGEVIVVDYNGMRSYQVVDGNRQAKCVFEYIYFARPDSVVFSRPVYEVRKALGRQLALEQPVEHADMVIPVPDSGVAAAVGYAQTLNKPFDMGLIRSHYVGRTFIEPEQRIRNFSVKMKLNPLPYYLKDKVIVVVDDSIVRGTTSKKIIDMLRARGPKEIHLRISSPPVKGACFYGIDTPSAEELIANRAGLDKIAEFIGADSIGYLSIEGMLKAVGGGKRDFCTACFDLDYPIKIQEV